MKAYLKYFFIYLITGSLFLSINSTIEVSLAKELPSNKSIINSSQFDVDDEFVIDPDQVTEFEPSFRPIE